MKLTTEHLDTVLHAYLAAALWVGVSDPSDPDNDTAGDGFDHDDIDAAAVESAREDCAAMIESAADLDYPGDAEQFGHDFYLTRCGHGAGFWDRGHGDVGDTLTELSKPYGDWSLYVGDDGRLYL